MVERSDDKLDQSLGARLGERLGWPTDRTDRLRGESQVYSNAMGQAAQADPGMACATVRRDLDFVRSQADIGEVEKQKRWIAASGRAPEDFVAIGRRQREETAAATARWERKRAAAASSAPASGAER